jgi:hypothetical protein
VDLSRAPLLQVRSSSRTIGCTPDLVGVCLNRIGKL